MTDTIATETFTPAEWAGNHYRLIGGSYDTLAGAITAIEAHFRNRHGSVGMLHVFKSESAQSTAAVIEAGAEGGDPLMVRALYKVVAAPHPR